MLVQVLKTLLLGAIKILNSLGIIDYVSFGSEIGEIKPLDDVATILAKEPREFSNILKTQLKSVKLLYKCILVILLYIWKL